LQRIIISVTNDIVNDQRVKKVCSTLQNNFEITLIGRKLKNSFPVNRPYRVIRMQLLFNKGFLFYAEYNLRLFFKILFLKKDVLLANDLDTLLPNYLISKILNKKLVYDSHELFTEVPELINRPKIRNVWLKIEEFIFPKLKNVYTVNDKISELYYKKYNTPVKVIKNVPFRIIGNDKNALPFQFKGQKIILYQGVINTGRGLELMISAMPLLDNFIFLIIGDGYLTSKIKKLVNEANLNHKVIFLGKIIPEKIIAITKQANLGISLEENLGLNYRYSLPNKIFDYVQSNIPVLASDLPIINLLFEEFKIGEILTSRSPENVAITVKEIVANKHIYQEALKHAAKKYNWENESNKILKIYANLE